MAEISCSFPTDSPDQSRCATRLHDWDMLDRRFVIPALLVLAQSTLADDRSIVAKAVEACRRLGIHCDPARAKVYRLNPPGGSAVHKVQMSKVEVELDEAGRAWTIVDRSSSSKSFLANPARAFALFGFDPKQFDFEKSRWGGVPQYTLHPRSHGYPSLVRAASLWLDPKSGSVTRLFRAKPPTFDPPVVKLKPEEASRLAAPFLKKLWDARKHRFADKPLPAEAELAKTATLAYATCYTNASRLAQKRAGTRARLAYVFQDADYRLLMDAETGECMGGAWLNRTGAPLASSNFPPLEGRR